MVQLEEFAVGDVTRLEVNLIELLLAPERGPVQYLELRLEVPRDNLRVSLNNDRILFGNLMKDLLPLHAFSELLLHRVAGRCGVLSSRTFLLHANVAI